MEKNLPAYSDLPDKEVLRFIYNDRCEIATKCLYNKYYKGGYNYLLSMYNGDKDSAVSMYADTYLNVINVLEKSPEKLNDSSYRSYFFGSLKRNFNQEYWKKMNRPNNDLPFQDIAACYNVSDMDGNMEDAIVRGEKIEGLFDWLKRILSELQYSIFMLKLDGLDYETIAIRLGVSEGTVRGKLSRARTIIKNNNYEF